MISTYDTVIVGAGICGLTAALELLAAGRSNILVLEAAPVVGGRARSMILPNGEIFNEGANWFHGGDANPFYQWAKERYDLGRLVADDKSRNTDVEVLWKAGDAAHLNKVFNDIDAAYEKMADPYAPLADIISFTKYPESADALAFMAAGWMAMDNASQMSAHEYFEDPLGPGGWQMADGMSHLMEQMAQEIRERGGAIRCGMPVTGLREQSGKVYISAANDSFVADNVIVTVTPGVLNARMIGFEGQVQSVIDEKIKGLQMGNLIKIIVPIEPDFFEKKKIENDTPVYMIDDHIFIHMKTAGKNAATIFLGGTQAREAEAWSESVTETFVRDTFGKVSGLSGWQDMQAGPAVLTGWGQNPYTCGSYSICAPHHKRNDPFAAGKILFTGEALLKDPQMCPGQMAGAWNAGRMAAHMLG